MGTPISVMLYRSWKFLWLIMYCLLKCQVSNFFVKSWKEMLHAQRRNHALHIWWVKLHEQSIIWLLTPSLGLTDSGYLLCVWLQQEGLWNQLLVFWKKVHLWNTGTWQGPLGRHHCRLTYRTVPCKLFPESTPAGSYSSTSNRLQISSCSLW